MEQYIPSSYTHLVDHLLSCQAPTGQGGHLEADTEDVTRALTRLDTAMYAFLACDIADALGPQRADAILRQGVRDFGRYRGNDIRRDVESRGLPLDVQRLLEYWDLPSLEESWDMQHKDRSPHYEGYDLPGCPFHDYLRNLCPQQYAVLMCEEVHVAVAKEFNPEIDVWYPSLLTRGQGRCLFRFSMTLDAAERAAHQAERLHHEAEKQGRALEAEKEAGMTEPFVAYHMMARLFCLFYHSLVNELLRAIGQDQTENIVRRATRKWGDWRGRDMAQDHTERGWPLNVENFVRYYDDLAAGDAWVADNVILTPEEHSKDVTTSAFAQFFNRLGTGRFAAMLWEEALPAQARAYKPNIETSIPKLIERGDHVTAIRYSMAD
jgi:hypothetical protein